MKNALKLKSDDPSHYYDIVKRIYHDGLAEKVFKTRHKETSQDYALKFSEPRNEKDREMFETEIAMMRLIKSDSILKIYEEFDFKNRLWVFIELMEGGQLTSLLDEMKCSYSEAFCKYTMYKVTKCLFEIHQQNIIHRDMKSDIVMINEHGDIKLSGFYYSTMAS